jgi:hypothetical protein
MLELRVADDRITVTDAELVQDGDKDTTYTLRPLLIDTYRDIVKQHTEYVINKRTHQRDPKTNWEATADALIDYVLLDWSGIHHHGEPVPCDRAWKLRLDAARRDALLEKAGYNEVARPAAEVKQESFREPGSVS